MKEDFNMMNLKKDQKIIKNLIRTKTNIEDKKSMKNFKK